MWRFVTILTTILAAANAGAQGKVTVANDSNHLFTLYGNPLPVSPLSTGHTLLAALYAGQTSGILYLQTTVTLDASGMLSPGRMINKNVTLNNIPGGTAAYFQIFVTDSATLPNAIPGAAGSAYFGVWTHFGTSGLFSAIPGASLTFANLANHASSTWASGPLEVNGCLGCAPPWFVTNPSNAVVNLGGDVSLTAYAQTLLPPTATNLPIVEARYLWRKQGAPIAGATNSGFRLTNVALSDAGNYDVVAIGFYGSTVSATATLTVFVPAISATLGSPAYTANNEFQFTVTGAVGSNYVVQVATNLTAPMAWFSLFTNASPFTFVDSDAQNFPQRFYRAYSF